MNDFTYKMGKSAASDDEESSAWPWVVGGGAAAAAAAPLVAHLVSKYRQPAVPAAKTVVPPAPSPKTPPTAPPPSNDSGGVGAGTVAAVGAAGAAGAAAGYTPKALSKLRRMGMERQLVRGLPPDYADWDDLLREDMRTSSTGALRGEMNRLHGPRPRGKDVLEGVKELLSRLVKRK